HQQLSDVGRKHQNPSRLPCAKQSESIKSGPSLPFTGRVERRRGRFRPMASDVSALSSIVANCHQVMPSTQEGFHGTQLVDFFYVRWTGNINIPKDGRYAFFLESDGSWLF